MKFQVHWHKSRPTRVSRLEWAFWEARTPLPVWSQILEHLTVMSFVMWTFYRHSEAIAISSPCPLKHFFLQHSKLHYALHSHFIGTQNITFYGLSIGWLLANKRCERLKWKPYALLSATINWKININQYSESRAPDKNPKLFLLSPIFTSAKTCVSIVQFTSSSRQAAENSWVINKSCFPRRDSWLMIK